MDNEERAFLKAIWRKPNDMTARLVYADWLDEHGYDWEADAVRYWARLDKHEQNLLRWYFVKWPTFHQTAPHLLAPRISRRAAFGILDRDYLTSWPYLVRPMPRSGDWPQYIKSTNRIRQYVGS